MKDKQPSSRYCFVCGVENPVGLHLHFYNTAPGEVCAEVVLPVHYQGYPGITHGGVIAAMLDEAAGRSQMGEGETPRFMFTARLNVQYRKNVPTEQPLRLVGRAGALKSRSAAATSALYAQDGTLLAEAEAVLVRIPEDKMDTSNLEDLGWKVYPDEA